MESQLRQRAGHFRLIPAYSWPIPGAFRMLPASVGITAFTESVVEEAARAWLESTGAAGRTQPVHRLGHACAAAFQRAVGQFWYHASMSAAHTDLDDLLEPLGACLTAEVAERVAKVRAPESAQARIEDLARKSDEGSLSDSEREEYEALVSAGTFIAILQSKARRLLKNSPA